MQAALVTVIMGVITPEEAVKLVVVGFQGLKQRLQAGASHKMSRCVDMINIVLPDR